MAHGQILLGGPTLLHFQLNALQFANLPHPAPSYPNTPEQHPGS